MVENGKKKKNKQQQKKTCLVVMESLNKNLVYKPELKAVGLLFS